MAADHYRATGAEFNRAGQICAKEIPNNFPFSVVPAKAGT
jgi:hypothetical protein